MIANYWTLAIITIFYFVWCEVRADQRSNKLNKLEFWKREPIDDTRRQQKKQTRNEKYPRTFQAVEDVNELNQILSYDEAHTDEINKNKDENPHSGRILLSGSNKNNTSSPIVWQNYVTDDKFKNKKELNLKHTKNYQDNTGGTENKNNFAIDHIHFKKYRLIENLRRENEDTATSNPPWPLSWKNLSVIKYTPAIEAATEQNRRNKAFRRWTYKTSGIPDKTGRTKVQGEYAIYDMFNKNYILHNRLKDRNKIVIRP